jgi:hypothetical protein
MLMLVVYVTMLVVKRNRPYARNAAIGLAVATMAAYVNETIFRGNDAAKMTIAAIAPMAIFSAFGEYGWGYAVMMTTMATYVAKMVVDVTQEWVAGQAPAPAPAT